MPPVGLRACMCVCVCACVCVMFHVSILMLMLMLERFLRRCHMQLYIVRAAGRRFPPSSGTRGV
jgi:uncharacterized membrane protein YhiD involved in acid resistance